MLVIGILIVVSTLGYIAFQKTLGKEVRETRIEITRQTNQYIDSKQTLILNLLTEYESSTSDAQRLAFARRACAESTKISPEFVPLGTRGMLTEGGCR